MSARMLVPKFVCRVSCASGFAQSMDSDVRRDTMSIVLKARINSITREKGNLARMRVTWAELTFSQDCVPEFY